MYFTLVSIIALLLFTAAAAAHPSNSATVREVDARYGQPGYGWPAAWSYNDLTFTNDRPARSALTHAERYMLAGSQSGAIQVQPWYLEVWAAVRAYELKHGAVPQQLSDEMVSDYLGAGNLDSSKAERFFSPITNRYPNLQASGFEPGALYMRPLTEDEVSHFCQFDTPLQSLVLKGLVPDLSSPGRMLPGKIAGKVWYIRVYGETQTIHEGLHYGWSVAR